MKNYLQMIAFIVVVGIMTSGLLTGMNLLTADRIAANQEAELLTTILNHNDEDYTIAELNDIFDSVMIVHEFDDIILYEHENSGSWSYLFEGSGLWGPIIGIITLESDFSTIRKITVLQEEETPGLGGIVSEEPYLRNYIGASMDPKLIVSRTADPDADNEVDAITGATGTSNAFESILNNNHETAKAAWESIQE